MNSKDTVYQTGNFVTGSAALDGDGHITHNSANGAFHYDADGHDADAAVQSVLTSSELTVTGADFSSPRIGNWTGAQTLIREIIPNESNQYRK